MVRETKTTTQVSHHTKRGHQSTQRVNRHHTKPREEGEKRGVKHHRREEVRMEGRVYNGF